MVLSGFFSRLPLISLSVIVSVLAISVGASLLRPVTVASTRDG